MADNGTTDTLTPRQHNVTLTIPRLPEERGERYEARVAYLMMGAARSLEAVRQKTGKKPASLRNLERWSSEDDWAGHARRYDETMVSLAVLEAGAAYRRDLADYRRRYGDMGKALYGSAAKMLTKMNKMLDKMDALPPGSLLTIINAAKTAADLEALSLRIEHLLDWMEDGRHVDTSE